MGGKAIIFRSDNCHRQVRGDLIERNPSMMPYRLFAFEELLGTADYHEGSGVNRDKAIQHHCQNSGNEEKSIRLRTIRKTFFILIVVVFNVKKLRVTSYKLQVPFGLIAQ